MESFTEFETVDVCDLCGHKDFVCLSEESSIKQCSHCSFVILSPRPTLREIERSYSDANAYADWIRDDRGRGRLWRNRFGRIEKLVAPGSKVLDYSAGIGTFMNVLNQNKCVVHGTEISSTAKRIALEKYNLQIENEDEIFNDRFARYFDAITAWHVLEHVESPSRLISMFWNLLREGGSLIIAVPNCEHLPLKNLLAGRAHPLSKLYPPLRPGDEIHLSYFSNSTLSQLLLRSGFKIQELGIDNHFASPSLHNSVKYHCYDLLHRVSGKNRSETIFAVASK